MKLNDTRGLRVFRFVNAAFLMLVSLIMIIPFWLIIVAAFSSENSITMYGYGLWPKEFSLDAFIYILAKGTIPRAYGVSIFVTVVGTLLAVVITAMMGYALSRPNMKYRNGISLVVYFTMLFNGGLVPWYVMMGKYGLRDNIWALILPICFSPWNMYLIKNFFAGLPHELSEAARIDGAGEFTAFWRIMLPLAKPGLATITLFYILAFWNDWWLALNLVTDTELYPLQYLLRQVMSNVSYAGLKNQVGLVTTVPSETVKMATCVVTIGPIILVYPFLQKYFIKGITVGAVKG